MASDVSIVSNETSILASLDNLLPTTAVRALVACIFTLALAVYLLRGASLSRATDNLHGAMCNMEWMYYRSAEAGLLGQCDTGLHEELSQ